MSRSSRSSLSLTGRNCLVTGGVRGIGAETVGLLLAAGANVTVVDRDLGTLPVPNDSRILRLQADVTDADAMVECVRLSVAHFGGLDVIVANAGITPPPATVRSVDRADFDRVMAVNFGGVLNTVRAGIEDVIARGGHVELVASCAAFTPGMGGAAYMVSKAAVEQLGRALSIELAAVGASAGVAYFGIVDTDLAAATLDDDPLGREIGALLTWPLNVRLTSTRAAHLLVESIENRRRRVVAPIGWWPYFWFRGVINPLAELRLVRDRRVHALLRSVEAREGHRLGASRSLPPREQGNSVMDHPCTSGSTEGLG